MSKPVNRQTDRRGQKHNLVCVVYVVSGGREEGKRQCRRACWKQWGQVQSCPAFDQRNYIILCYSYSIFLSVCYNGHLSRWTCVSRYRNFSILDFNGGAKDDAGGTVVVTSGATRRAKLQSNCHHQLPTFSRPDVIPVAKPTVSKHWRENFLDFIGGWDWQATYYDCLTSDLHV